MIKALVAHLPFIAVAVVAGGLLAGVLSKDQKLQAVNMDKLSSAPIAGLHKFAADVDWMLFINFCGSNNKVTPEISDEIYKRLKRIISLDPDFVPAYETGALMISHTDSAKAVEILKLGAENPRLKSNWKIPFLAGFVMSHFAQKKDYGKAETFFREALSRADLSDKQVFSSLIYVKSQRILESKFFTSSTGKKLAVSTLPQARLCALYDEWRKIQNAQEKLGYNMGLISNETLSPLVLKQAQQVKNDNPTPDCLAMVEEIKNKVFKDQHLCESCLKIYRPGEKFCGACGKNVDLYGTCAKCAAVLSEQFCSSCGLDSRPIAKK